MNILHIGDVAGVSQEISRAQRNLGYKSDVLSFQKHPFGYITDFSYPIESRFPINRIKMMKIFSRFINKYDVYHFHGGTLLPRGIDSMFWKLLGKKLIIHHHGSEIRYKKEPKAYLLFADKIIVSTPDLLEWSSSKSIWIPNPICLKNLPYVGVKSKSSNERINVVHAPTNRIKKGTDYIIDAVEKLKDSGFNINLILVEGVEHDKAIEYYKEADIVIDQLVIGWYGVFSIECMALGKPVCCYIHKDLETYMPFNPIVNIKPENIVKSLRMLIEDERLRKVLSEKGRKYVEEVHDSDIIAKRLIKYYLDIHAAKAAPAEG